MTTDKAVTGGRATVIIRSAPDRVWALITDITRTGEWSPENLGGVWVDGASGPAVGARFKATNRRGKAKWSTTCEVTVADPAREFAFVTGTAAKHDTAWRYVLEPVEEGTRVTESFELTKPLGAASRLLTRVTTGVRDRRADLEENTRVSLENLKRIAET